MKVRLLIILSLILFSCDSGGGGAVHGCSDSEACNYNPQTTVDNNTCEYSDVNYDCDGNCIFEVGCTCSDCPLIIGDWVGITEDYDFQHPGCEPYYDFTGQDASGRSFTFEDNCTYSEIYDYPDEYGEGEGIFICNSNMITVCNNNTGCITAVYTFADGNTDTFNAVWTQTEDDCTYSVSLDLEREVIEIQGCTNESACNYDSNATESDGSCFYPEGENYDCEGNCIAIGDNLVNGYDCGQVCGGDDYTNECGECTSFSNSPDEYGCCPGETADCAGVCHNTGSNDAAYVDVCGQCGGSGCMDENGVSIPFGSTNCIYGIGGGFDPGQDKVGCYCDCDGNRTDCDLICGGTNFNCSSDSSCPDFSR